MTTYWKTFTKTVTCCALLTVVLGAFAPWVHSSPIGFWRAEGDSLDSVGTNHATMLAGASFAPGQIGQAFSLDGTLSTGIIFADGPWLRFPHNFTLAAWVNTTAAGTPSGGSSYADILRKRHRDHGGLMDIALGMVNGRARFALTDDAGVTDVPGGIQGGTPINNGQWHHIAAVRDDASSMMKLYVNGSLEASNATTTGTFVEVNGVPWTIGNSGGTTEFPWNGLIDEVVIFNCALSDQQLLDLANGNSIPGLEIEPWIALTGLEGGSYQIKFTGILETSMDLGPSSWAAVLPPPCGPYVFTPTMGDAYRFFRARKP